MVFAYNLVKINLFLKLFFKRVVCHSSGQMIALDYNGKQLKFSGYPIFPKEITKPFLPYLAFSKKHDLKVTLAAAYQLSPPAHVRTLGKNV